ncbi:uncharacterized protein FOMMEDRAFT_31151 [Fomitiporia mediterranea MF3/22]|uniref:uncharacterized protein n=1 Tax=Fomitiporia mediterranea (strain MF3/22) TaxID=694068 RepID=UPI0004408FFF|nr:uncharacterized protein FOMMEDRAFT_31151 [Fomitiporia mediterranea MF3/22]EJC99409.1 hypothetical protein FOMMEDRAFT_31151 [Fomitiporia mediterranea MF3/22]
MSVKANTETVFCNVQVLSYNTAKDPFELTEVRQGDNTDTIHTKDMLQKYAEDHYPVNLAKERRICWLRRDKEQDIEDERHNAFWDWIDAFQMKVHGIRPEDIKAEEEQHKKEAEELETQRIAGWQKSVDESFCDEHNDNSRNSSINEEDKEIDTCSSDDKKLFSIEVALSRSPPLYGPYPI